MPKQKLIIRDFSGGMNTKRDSRDIAENESSYMNNFSVDAIGKLKTAGGLYSHIKSNDGSTNLTEYISGTNVNIVLSSDTTINAGGYGVFYFESDYKLNNSETIELIKTGGSALALGTSNGTIQFVKTSTRTDAPAYIPVRETE
tara:strand:+ start:506 stop:937 length:432 start_codon:yes stop_codon:yes gene_type:complete